MFDVSDCDLPLAVSYIRVSTKRQADEGVSLDEQRRANEAEAARLGYKLVAEFIDGGSSGRSDRRPEFQRMIAECCSKDSSVKAVVIYNFSRFFRDDYELEGYRRKLEKAGVELLSATQQIAAGPHAKLQRAVITAMDAAQSEITAEAVTQMMRANAAAGYWNGSTPPLGYETYVAESKGKKQKKKLRIVPAEANQVSGIIARCLGRNGGEMPGIGKLAKLLNDLGETYRGRPFTPNLVHTILTRESYTGRHFYNTVGSRTRKPRPREEWIEVPVPRIISDEDFAAVQKLLKSRDPKMAPARSHSSPVSLSGLGKCGNPGCTGTMMLMTGKSGQHRYYACSNVRRKKDRSCGGNNVPMQKVDDAVMAALKQRLLQPSRLNTLLSGLIERSEGADAKRRQSLGVLRSERTEVENSIRRVFEMVESGMVEPGDSDFKSRLAAHQKRRAALDEEIRTLDRQIGQKGKRIDEAAIASFAHKLRSRLDDPENPALRKNYVKAFVGEVVMTKRRIVIHGPVSALTAAVTSSDEDEGPPVRSSMVDWCTRQDSNL